MGKTDIKGFTGEQIRLALDGAGAVTLASRYRNIDAGLGGIGNLEARELLADPVDLSMTGLGGASVYAKTAATLSLSGMGSATVYGKPAKRKSTSSGLGSINWQ